MTYEDALTFINSLLSVERVPKIPSETSKLQRVKDLLYRVGDPHRRLAIVLVAGTKGKGSTAAMLASIMQRSGLRVGLYTKPHLVDYRERIQVNGTLIAPEALTRVVEVLQPHVEAMRDQPYGPPTYFDVSVALAFLHFSEIGVDLAVMEVGLGGRLDATNIADPVASVVTPVSYDHMEILGTTLDAIAREKAGIIRTHGVVVSAPQAPEALASIIDVCARQEAKLWLVDEVMRWQGLSTTPYEQSFALSGPWGDYGTLALPLIGAHQLVNAATATATAELLRERGFPLVPEAIREGLAALRWPARIEVLREHPYVVVDVAHNPASIGALRQVLEGLFSGRRIVLVFGMVATHDHRACTSLIAPLAEVAIVTTPQHVRPLPARVLAEEVGRYVARVEVVEDRTAAVERALELADAEDVVVITGSFFLVGDVREALRRKQPGAARTPLHPPLASSLD